MQRFTLSERILVMSNSDLGLKVTSSSAIAERPRDARVTSIRKIAKLNF